MTFLTLLYAYVLGGVTFIPLVLVAVLVPAWRLLPRAEDVGNQKPESGEKKEIVDDKTREGLLAAHEEKYDGAASGTFAVLRSYDFAAASTALGTRSSSNAGHGGTASSDHAAEGHTNSESVYQSMYRSVFDRSKNTPSHRTVLENEDDAPTANGRVKKRTTPANVFYIILRHGHLILYDSSTQLEVRHVISLAHHDLSLSEGPHSDAATMKDGDLFIKRTAIVLTPTDLPSGGLQTQALPSKPFYLFSATCVEKEDFYHALLYTRSSPPLPIPLEPTNLVKLQSTLHSTSLTPETRALNAVISRIFLALHRTDYLKTLIRNKIEKKISRVQKPAFIASLAVQSIDLGDAAPVFSNLRLKDLNISGDVTVALDMRYIGGIKLTIAALAKLDLGARFKTRTADLVLATSIQRMIGHMLFRIKPPPSNRLWFSFEEMPEMEIKVEPVVSQRQITYTFILKAIEDRIRTVVAETLVKPNWDDIAFYDTRGQTVRGGIWSSEGAELADDATPTASNALGARNEKTKSMPTLAVNGPDGGESSATSSGSETPSRLASIAAANELTGDHLKRRSVTSLPARSASTTPLPNDTSVPPTKALRSPSLTSPSASTPTIALDAASANFDPTSADDAAQAQQAARKWRIRTKAEGVKKDAVETMREMRDRSLKEDAEAETGSISASDEPGSPTSTNTSFADRSLRSSKRTGTNMSSATSASTSTTRSQQQRKNILAAAQAAREWSWNAIATRTKNAPSLRSNSVASNASQEPMGRGQPLPPPGQPLPGPQKGFIADSLGSLRRKPVPAPALPPRRREESGRDAKDFENAEVTGDEGSEFGDWNENSGADVAPALPNALTDDEIGDTIKFETPLEEKTPKVPPPLPARPKPKPAHSQSKSVFEVGGLESGESDGRRSLDPTVPAEKHTDLGSIRDDEEDYAREPLTAVQSLNQEFAARHGSDGAGLEQDSFTDELVAIPAPIEGDVDVEEGISHGESKGPDATKEWSASQRSFVDADTLKERTPASGSRGNREES